MLAGRSVILAASVAAAAWDGCAAHGAAGRTAAEALGRPAIAIENVAIVDVVRGEIVAPQTVLVVNGRIAAVGETEAVVLPEGVVRVDGRGRYLMPGLVDLHVHLFNNFSGRPPNDWTFPLFVANGVTAVREMAAQPSDLRTIAAWRTAVDRGELIAPHIAAAGVAVRSDSPSALRESARAAQTAGADFLKVFSGMREPYWRALMIQAAELRLPVCGHIPAEASVLDPLAAAQRSNEHLMQVFEACSAHEEQFLAARRAAPDPVAARDAQERAVLDAFNQQACDQVASLLAKTAQAQVPTLVLAHCEARSSPARRREDSRWPSLRPDEQARWDRALDETKATDQALRDLRRDVSLRIVKTLHAAGVPILGGTDSPMPLVYPGWALHTELELLVEAGLSPAEALRSATINAVEFLRTSDTTGSVAPGKCADLVMLDDNPLRDIKNTQRIRAVLLGGRLLQREDLDALLLPPAPTPAR